MEEASLDLPPVLLVGRATGGADALDTRDAADADVERSALEPGLSFVVYIFKSRTFCSAVDPTATRRGPLAGLLASGAPDGAAGLRASIREAGPSGNSSKRGALGDAGEAFEEGPGADLAVMASRDVL